MKPKIIVECPLLSELLKVFIQTDALTNERERNDDDVPVDTDTKEQTATASTPAEELSKMLTEYLNLYCPEAPECATVIDEEDQVMVLIDLIVADIIATIPDAKLIRVDSETQSSVFVYCDYCEEDLKEEGDDSDY